MEKNEYQFKNEDLQLKLSRANSKLNDVKKFHEKVNHLNAEISFFLILYFKFYLEKEAVPSIRESNQAKSRSPKRKSKRAQAKRAEHEELSAS